MLGPGCLLPMSASQKLPPTALPCMSTELLRAETQAAWDLSKSTVRMSQVELSAT